MAVTTTSASYAYALNNLIQPDNTAIPAEWKSVGQTAIVLYRGTGLGSQPLQASVWKTKIETLTPDAEVEVKPTDPVPANNEAQTLQVQLLALYGDTVPPQSGTATSASSTTSSTTPITSTQSEPPSGSSSTGTITPTPSKSLEPAHNARLPDGAVAGIAIATAIAGAALAATVLFFLFFKRNRQRRDHPSDMAARQKQSGSGGAGNNGRGLSDDGVAGGLGKGARTSGLDYILPQPLDDGNIKAAVSDFFKRIEDHVDSRFYPDVPASGEKGPTETSNELALLAVQPDLDVSVLLSESHTRFQVLKALVCAETLAAIDFEGTSARSLLPSVVTAFLSKISPNLQDNHPTRLSLSRWRTSTRYLLGDRTSSEERARHDQAANAIVETLTPVLRRYAQPQHEEERRADLVRVCRKAEQLGLLLLDQPAEWMVDWEAEAPKETTGRDGRRKAPPKGQGMVVFPALVKVTDDAARIIQPRRVVIPQIRADTVR